MSSVGSATDSSEPFARVGTESLHVLLDGRSLNRKRADAVAHIMDGFDALTVHPDVDAGTKALADLGTRLVTLSDGSADVDEALLHRAGIRDRFELLLSVEDAGLWKPAAPAYAYAVAAMRCGTGRGHAGGRSPVGRRRGSPCRPGHGVAQPRRRPLPRLLPTGDPRGDVGDPPRRTAGLTRCSQRTLPSRVRMAGAGKLGVTEGQATLASRSPHRPAPPSCRGQLHGQ
ncbi:MAG: HAD family hydrolase [Euzebya sp.]